MAQYAKALFEWEIVRNFEGLFVRETRDGRFVYEYGPVPNSRYAEAMIAERQKIAQMVPISWREFGRKELGCNQPTLPEASARKASL